MRVGKYSAFTNCLKYLADTKRKELDFNCSKRCRFGGCLGKGGYCWRVCYCYGVSIYGSRLPPNYIRL